MISAAEWLVQHMACNANKGVAKHDYSHHVAKVKKHSALSRGEFFPEQHNKGRFKNIDIELARVLVEAIKIFRLIFRHI